MGLLDHISFSKHQVFPPEAIEVTAKGELRLTWPGGQVVTVTAHDARDACPCAACIEEGTGKKILDPASIPADIHPTNVQGVGNYAVQITWSDGHSSGIYTWKLLREICGLG